MNIETYLSNNPIVNSFINEVNQKIKEYYGTNLPNLPLQELQVSVGSKFIKLVHKNCVWGFISRYDGVYKGVPIKKGDLLKAASWASPAKHSRGSIVDGTAKYGVYGPTYM